MARTSSDRIDGWKAIGAHFGRDRTTVVRWTKERGLPVKRIPGGKKATVYASKAELDARAMANADDVTSEPEASHEPQDNRPAKPYLALGIVVAMLIAVSAFVYSKSTPSPVVPDEALPQDRAVAELYLNARDKWAERTSKSISSAIEDLKQVVTRAPDYAPGHAALADAYLLARDYGDLRDQDAFPAARSAALAALKIDPDLGAAHRAIGFIQYWHDHEPIAAQKSFERAIALDPKRAQTHLWYGNVLADNGAHTKAIAQLQIARRLNPGAVEILTNLGWALWAGGRRDEAVKLLTETIASNPNFAGAHDCLSVIRLSEGDLNGYAAGVEARAKLRRSILLEAYGKAVWNAVRKNDERELRNVIFDHGARIASAPGGENHVWSAYNATLASNRDRVIFAITQGEALRENWGSAVYLDRIIARWKDDPEIVSRIEQLRAPRLQ